MRVIQPAAITDPMVTFTSAPAEPAGDDPPAWAVGTTYALGALVHRTTTHRRYRSLIASNTGNTPETTVGIAWQEVGGTTRWAMFDQLAGSRSTRATPIDVTLTPGVVVNSIVALGLSGGTLTVTQRDGSTVVFSRTVQLVDGVPVLDWWGYFFDPIQQLDTVSIVSELLPIGTSTIQVQLTAVSGNVSIGSLIVGVVRDLGVTLADAEISGTDYSRAEFDTALGITLLDRNAFRSRLALKVAVPAGAVDATVRLLKSLTGRPVVWLADNDGRYQSMAVLGFPTRWSKVLQYPTVSFLNITIEEML